MIIQFQKTYQSDIVPDYIDKNAETCLMVLKALWYENNYMSQSDFYDWLSITYDCKVAISKYSSVWGGLDRNLDQIEIDEKIYTVLVLKYSK